MRRLPEESRRSSSALRKNERMATRVETTMATYNDGFHDRITRNNRSNDEKKSGSNPGCCGPIFKTNDTDSDMEDHHHGRGNRTSMEVCLFSVWNTANNNIGPRQAIPK